MNRSITFLFILLNFMCFSQSFEKIEDIAYVKNKIQEKSNSTNSISANFIEEVHSSMYNTAKQAEGKLNYRKGNHLRWEHISPEPKLLLIHDGNLRMFENGTEIENIEKNKIVGRIKSIMLQLFNGEFLDSDDFIIGYYKSSKQYKLKLAPRSKRISKHMKYLELLFDIEKLTLDKLTLFDTDEDKVVYSFSSVKFDQNFSDNLFTEP